MFNLEGRAARSSPAAGGPCFRPSIFQCAQRWVGERARHPQKQSHDACDARGASFFFCSCICIGGCRTLCALGKGCGGEHDPQKSAAGKALRPGAFAFYHLQLLPATRVPADSRRSSGAISVCAGWLRGDAGAHPSANLGTEVRHSQHSDAGVEAARVAFLAPETPPEPKSIAAVEELGG